MLNEEQIRDLLRAAGDTITPEPSTRPIAPVRRRTPYLLGAAAVVVAVVSASLVGLAIDHGKDRPDPSRTVKLPSPEMLPPSSQHYTLRPDQTPLLVGWKIDDARQLLESRGVKVSTRHDANFACRMPSGRVASTDPTVGSRVRGGDVVTLVLPPERVHDCVGEGWPPDLDLAWRLVDFAEGRGPAPAFAHKVTLWLGTRFSRTITAQQAKDPANWVVCSDNGVVCASALHDLVEMKYQLVNDEPREPHLKAERGSSSYFRFPQFPDDQDSRVKDSVMSGREALRVSYWIPTDGIFDLFPSVDVFRSDDRIDAVATWTDLNPDGTAGVPVPDVVGMYGPQAGEALQNSQFGGSYDVTGIDDCDDEGQIIAVSPRPGTLVRPLTRLTVTACQLLSLEPDPDRVGRDFVQLVRKGGAPPSADEPQDFAPTVDLYLGNRKLHTITRPEAYRASSWEICPPEGDGYAEATCPFSAWTVIADENPRRIVYSGAHPELGACATGMADAALPEDRFVHVGLAEPDSCMNNWDVELYYDRDRQITAVNLLHGSP
jgi:hypothetical protein